MRLNEFGREARLLRMKFDASLKSMAEFMGISSAHLSALEYGDKKINDAHIANAVRFFKSLGANEEDLNKLRAAGAQSMETVSVKTLNGNARELVVAFARALEDGQEPSREIVRFLQGK